MMEDLPNAWVLTGEYRAGQGSDKRSENSKQQTHADLKRSWGLTPFQRLGQL